MFCNGPADDSALATGTGPPPIMAAVPTSHPTTAQALTNIDAASHPSTSPSASGDGQLAGLRVGYNVNQDCIACLRHAESPVTFTCSCTRMFALCANHLDHFRHTRSSGLKHDRDEQPGTDTRQDGTKKLRSNGEPHVIVHLYRTILKSKFAI